MKILFELALGLIFTTILASCGPAVSVSPVSSPLEAKRDERLVGVWVQEENGVKNFLHFAPRGTNRIKIFPISHSEKDSDGASLIYELFSSELGDRRFMNVKLHSVNEQKDAEVTRNWPGYIFVWYEVTKDNVLRIRIVKEGGFAKTIDAGKLEGEVVRNEEKKVIGVKVEATIDKLAAYLSKSDLDDDFNKVIEFRKMIEPEVKK
ncbi:MAG: hypothetical protein HY291_08080 [Planctomycetes bacterium]|nr:hypothetical protein [Planctomycetota bacterium]